MAMHFIFSDEAVLLFDFWSVHSPAGMALSVLVVLLLAVLYEGIKVGKAKLLHHTLMSLPTATSQQLILETDQDSAGAGSDSSPVSSTNLRKKGHRGRWKWEKETEAEQPDGGEKIQEDDERSHWKTKLL
ncbi:protein SLC31A2 isoform 3-T3 [Callospermophilus lateralis]|uniref:protein SLC31A2 isoform X3 n=1 Tax=Callospermophilus lateralis TaxID=76772 RepID=UPI0040543518